MLIFHTVSTSTKEKKIISLYPTRRTKIELSKIQFDKSFPFGEFPKVFYFSMAVVFFSFINDTIIILRRRIVTIARCKDLAVFLSLLFYVKSILADFKSPKTAIITILEALNFDFLGNSYYKCEKIPKN